MTAIHPPLIFHSFALTHRGRVRAHNEDCVAALPEQGLWVVADGMGGHAAGATASALIIEELSALGPAASAADQRARFREGLDRANARILAFARAQGLDTVGSTVAALLIHGAHATWVWVGDSRVYRLRGGRLTRLSRDHSEVGALVAAGAMSEEEARVSPLRNVITRAVGIAAAVEPEQATGRAEGGDRFLVCSDGLTEHLSDAEIAVALAGPGSVERIARGLVEQTLRDGARDNVSVVLIDCIAAPVTDGQD